MGGKRREDLTGRTFGRLYVLEFAGNKTTGKTKLKSRDYWLCECECGKIKEYYGYYILKGLSKSCGCLNHELTSKRSYKHGKSGWFGKSKLYDTWCGIIDRCCNPNSTAYKNYGGRGIIICEEWRNDFECFYNYIGEPPTKEHSIDRIDVNGNYEPGNVRWATRAEQSRNTRRNHMITYENETMCMMDWAIKLGISYDLIRGRLKKGYTVEQAFTYPANVKRKYYSAN